jgi:hypothetical protein
MTNKLASNEVWRTKDNAVVGALAGMGITSPRHVHHAISNQVPDNVVMHVFSENAIGIVAGGTFTTVVSAHVNRSR